MAIISKILLKIIFFFKLKYLLITLHFLQQLEQVVAFIVALVIFKDETFAVCYNLKKMGSTRYFNLYLI